MSALRHTEECTRIVSNRRMSCNCGARGAWTRARYVEQAYALACDLLVVDRDPVTNLKQRQFIAIARTVLPR